MRYLSYALYPLVIGYAIYALVYESHKSWYSWILNSLVGAVYTFGFILMCPQVLLVGSSLVTKYTELKRPGRCPPRLCLT